MNIVKTSRDVLSFAKYGYFWRRMSHQWPRLLENVKNFGRLSIRCPVLPAIIRPLSVEHDMMMDKAFVNITHPSPMVSSKIKKFVHIGVDGSILNIEHTFCDADLSQELELSCLVVEVPPSYDINVTVKSLTLSDMQSSKCVITCVDGDLVLSRIKAEVLDVNVSGNVLCRDFLHGDARFDCTKSVAIKKIQGRLIAVSSLLGSIEIDSVYSESFTCGLHNGKAHIGSLHGDSKIVSKSADVSINSASGCLNVSTESGSIDVNIENGRHVELSSGSGDISVGISPNHSPFLLAEGCSVDVYEGLVADGLKREDSVGRQYFEGKVGLADDIVSAKSKSGVIRFFPKPWFSNVKWTD